MRRRQFITLLGGAAAPWPLAVRAQQRDRMRRLGVLIGSDDNADARALFSEFQQALKLLGWSYGDNVQMDIRWGSDTERRAAYAKELVRLNPDVIFAAPSNVVLALQRDAQCSNRLRASVRSNRPRASRQSRPTERQYHRIQQSRFSITGETGAIAQGHRTDRYSGRSHDPHHQRRFGALLSLIRCAGAFTGNQAYCRSDQ